jgi:predicted transposase/invertase (TIGR01784 family)
MKFVDVKNDVAFHKVFGSAHKTITLISFLNAVLLLEGEERIVSVVIENPYLFPPSHAGKSVVLDVRATDHLGRHFIVEVQVADKEGFEKRTRFYMFRNYTIQMGKGANSKMLRPTYLIGILDFSLTLNPHYYSHHQTIDTATGEFLLKDIQYFFIELPKFKKKLHELTTMMDKWTFFIKNAENLDIIPENVEDEGLRAAYQQANEHTWSAAELNAYFDAEMRDIDHVEERAKAKIEGKIEGKIEKEKEAILGLHKIGVPLEKIAEGLRITIEYAKNVIDNA